MIYVYYRHYREDLYFSTSRDPNKVRPIYYSPSLCLFSILDSIRSNSLREYFRVVIWYDGSQEDFDGDPINIVLAKFVNDIYIFKIRKNFRGMGDNSAEKISAPALLQYCANNHSDGDFVYLVENDYLHDLQSMTILKILSESETQFHYATLYDAPDYYRLNMHLKFRGNSVLIGGLPWREVLTTTGTYFTSAKILKEDLGALLHTADFYSFVKLVGLRARVLIAPYYSLASHSMIGQESPIRTSNYTIGKYSE